MLGKLLKYDFKFSRAQFFVMAIATLFCCGLIRVFKLANTGFAVAFFIALTAMLIACVILVYQHFQKSLFSGEGYLMLTLPVKRNRLLLSKGIVSVVWFNFMLAVGLLAVLILDASSELFGMLTAEHIISLLLQIVVSNLLAVNGILLLFLLAAAANVSVGGRRVGAVLSGVLCAAVVTLEILLGSRVLDPLFGGEGVAIVAGRGLMLLSRVPKQASVYVSLPFAMLIPMLLFSALLYLALLHILKRRIDLQ